jgi:mRNA-degrading endonuclease RelE of RelBE toxin-antitoxin system
MIIAKAAQKVIDRADKPTQAKLNKALAKIECGEGYIEPLKNIKRGMEDDLFRYKMEHYRIIFKRNPLTIKSIGTKNATTFKRTGCM